MKVSPLDNHTNNVPKAVMNIYYGIWEIKWRVARFWNEEGKNVI